MQPVRTADISAVVVVSNAKGRMKDQHCIPFPRLHDLLGKFIYVESSQ